MITQKNTRNSNSEFTRRLFLARLGVVAAGCALPAGDALLGLPMRAADGGVSNQALVGSNVYGWTQYYQRENKPFDIEGVMSALRDAGYDYLEANLDSQNPDKNGQLAEQMKNRGLKPVTLYTGGRLHEAGVSAQTVERIVKAANWLVKSAFL